MVHVGFADPYCTQGRRAVRSDVMPVVDGGTLVVIQADLHLSAVVDALTRCGGYEVAVPA